VVNASGLAFGEGGSTGQVTLGRAGTIVKPVAIPSSAPIEHTPTRYTVRQGEDVYAIAKKFNISADELRWSNPDRLTKTDLVKSGDQLLVPPVDGVVVAVKATDTIQAIANAYKVDPQGIVDFNYLRDPEHLTAGAALVVPCSGHDAPATTPPTWVRTRTGNSRTGNARTTSRAAAMFRGPATPGCGSETRRRWATRRARCRSRARSW
jgi:LysM repeat protein